MNGGAINGGYRSSCCGDPAATDSFLEWRIPLGSGDWTMQVFYETLPVIPPSRISSGSFVRRKPSASANSSIGNGE